jgi:hypothetical protein
MDINPLIVELRQLCVQELLYLRVINNPDLSEHVRCITLLKHKAVVAKSELLLDQLCAMGYDLNEVIKQVEMEA